MGEWGQTVEDSWEGGEEDAEVVREGEEGKDGL